MKARDDLWYHRGRAARAVGDLRDKVDGRLTPAHRAAFQRGWDEEAAQRVQATPEERAEARDVVARLKAWAQTELGGAR